MTITLNLPDGLVRNVMEITRADSYDETVRVCLENLVRKEMDRKFAERFGGADNFDVDEASKYVDVKDFSYYFGKIPELKKEIDLDVLRGRNDHIW